MSLIFSNTVIEKMIFNGVELDKINFNGVTVFEKIRKIDYTPEMVQKIVSPYGTSVSLIVEEPQSGGEYDTNNITTSGSVPISSLNLNSSTKTLSFNVGSCNKGLTSTINIPVVNCNDYFDYTIPVEISSCTHPNLTYVSATSATCTAAGTSAHYKCTCSNNTLNSSGDLMSTYIAPLGHNYTYKNTSSSRLRTAATCTSAATYYYECTRCSSYTTSSWFSYGSTISHSYSSGYCSMCGTAQPVTITSNPSSQTVSVGVLAHFSVSASGYSLSYQWQVYKNGSWSNSSASSATNRTLAIEGATSRNGFKYRCIVTSSNGKSATSGAATLTVT